MDTRDKTQLPLMARIGCPLVSNTSFDGVYRHGLVATFCDTESMVQFGVLGRSNRRFWVIRPSIWTHGTDTCAKGSTNMI